MLTIHPDGTATVVYVDSYDMMYWIKLSSKALKAYNSGELVFSDKTIIPIEWKAECSLQGEPEYYYD